jgi:hypothetical protein
VARVKKPLAAEGLRPAIAMTFPAPPWLAGSTDAVTTWLSGNPVTGSAAVAALMAAATLPASTARDMSAVAAEPTV